MTTTRTVKTRSATARSATTRSGTSRSAAASSATTRSTKSAARAQPFPELPLLPSRASVPVANGTTARFECVFPSCGGICCKNGRPGLAPGEARRIRANLSKFLPLVTTEARRVIEQSGFLTRRVKEGRRTLAVSRGWCVFFHGGCVLHKVGATEGNAFAYKPWHCVAFPLEKDKHSGEWYVRQHGYRGEGWDLFCISPRESEKPALATLGAELAFAAGIERGDEDWRGIGAPKLAPAARAEPASRTSTGPTGEAGGRATSRRANSGAARARRAAADRSASRGANARRQTKT